MPSAPSHIAWAALAALGIILNAGYFLWLFQRMFFGNIDNPKNEGLRDLKPREWAYMTPLMILALWIGIYPKPFFEMTNSIVDAIIGKSDMVPFLKRH